MERTSCIDWLLLLLLGCIQKSIIREKPDPNATIFFPYKSTRSHAHTARKKLKVGVKYQTLQIIGSQKCFSMKAWKWEKGAWPCMRGKEETGRWRAKIKIIYNKAKARKKAFVGIVKRESMSSTRKCSECILCWMYSCKDCCRQKEEKQLICIYHLLLDSLKNLQNLLPQLKQTWQVNSFSSKMFIQREATTKREKQIAVVLLSALQVIKSGSSRS